MSETYKAVVRRLITEVLNGGHLEVVDELYAPELAGAARRWITPFRASFPDVHMEIVELIAEGDKVVGRFTCSATHLGNGWGIPRPGAASSESTRSPSSGCEGAGSSMPGAWRTPSPGCGNSDSPHSRGNARRQMFGAGATGPVGPPELPRLDHPPVEWLVRGLRPGRIGDLPRDRGPAAWPPDSACC